MSEYTSIRTSSWDVDAMVTKLNEHSRDGWSLVTVVNTGADLAAILRRDGGSSSTVTAAAVTAAVVEPERVAVPVEVAPVEVASVTPSAIAEPAGWGAVVEPTSTSQMVESVIDPMPSMDTTTAYIEPAVTHVESVVTHVEPAVTPIDTVSASTAQQSAPTTPAGWYPDPSGRFEMRYWDGAAWTEHVARGGQQYTDPPVA